MQRSQASARGNWIPYYRLATKVVAPTRLHSGFPRRFTSLYVFLLGLRFPRLFLLLVRRWLSNGELCPQSPPPLINNTASRIQFVPKTSKHTVHLGGILLLVLCMVISSPVYTFLFSFSTRDNSRLRLPSLPSYRVYACGGL